MGTTDATRNANVPLQQPIAPLSWCTWYGVKCVEASRFAPTTAHRHITSLDLSDNGLSGKFPSRLFCSRDGEGTSVFGFDELLVLNVSHNQLFGHEPFLHAPGPSDPAVANSSTLMPTSYADDSAAVCKHASLRSKLEVLDVSFNKLKSSLRYLLRPEAVVDGASRPMPKLRWLSIRCNAFHDVIAAGLTTSSSNNHKTSSSSLRGLMFPMLEWFDAGENHLVGEFPAASFAHHTPFLQVLKLDNNFFVNTAMSWLMGGSGGGDDGGELRWAHTLTTLHLQYNYIQATIPTSVDRFTSLRELYVDGNRIYGTIPRELRSLRNLEVLSVAHNYLRGSLPCAKDRWFSELTPFLRLRVMDFTDNELEGSICPVVASHRVEILRFADNAFRGAVPQFDGLRLTEVTLGGENRWECDLPDPTSFPAWVDPAPSTKCLLGDSVGTSEEGHPKKRWGGAEHVAPGVTGSTRRRGSWWHNGLLGLLMPSPTTTKKSTTSDDAQPLGVVARHLFSLLLALVVVVPLSAALMKLAGVHVQESATCTLPGWHWFLDWIGYEPPTAAPASVAGAALWDDDESDFDSDCDAE